MPVEPIEAVAPESAIEIEPLAGRGQSTRVQAAHTMLPPAFTHDERGRLQDPQMTRNRGQRNIEGLRQFADRQLARGEAAQDGAARRVRERGEWRAEVMHLTSLLIHTMLKPWDSEHGDR